MGDPLPLRDADRPDPGPVRECGLDLVGMRSARYS